MNQSLCREFISHLDRSGSLNPGNAPKHISKWLEELGLPMDLLRFMQWAWPQTDCQIAHISIMSSESLYADEATAKLLKYKFLNVGSAPNGDIFAIDFSTKSCVPGFITHEEWNPLDDEPQDPREYFEPIARTVDSFLYRVVEGKYLPTDYYAAREFNQFL
ncbi:MAG: hypothetical protein AB1705_16755, partial [Verrucomicrobiota bacterium]